MVVRYAKAQEAGRGAVKGVPRRDVVPSSRPPGEGAIPLRR